jgi:hypothetical protein
MRSRNRHRPLLTLFGSALSLVLTGQALAEGASQDSQVVDQGRRRGPSITRNLPVSTQGPFWPPAEVTDENGDFLLVGQVLEEVAPGQTVFVPNQAVVVSKDTVPALRSDGVEDADNWFGAGYDVIRPLDLRRGSPDLDTVLWALSFGPYDHPSGAPRIPAEGDSAFNLNKDLVVCADAAPASSQRSAFRRERVPLHLVPIPGFQGDGVVKDPDTGESSDPMSATGCGQPRCPGEDEVDVRAVETPITLGQWLRARGRVKIQLENFDRQRGGFTHARFTFKMRDLIPYGLYTVWGVRLRTVPIPGVFERRDIDPLATPNVIAADENGNATASFLVEHPFPDAATDTRGLRIIGLSLVWHSDYQTKGACFSRTGPGVDVHAQFNTLIDGSGEIAPGFVTVGDI